MQYGVTWWNDMQINKKAEAFTVLSSDFRIGRGSAKWLTFIWCPPIGYPSCSYSASNWPIFHWSPISWNCTTPSSFGSSRDGRSQTASFRRGLPSYPTTCSCTSSQTARGIYGGSTLRWGEYTPAASTPYGIRLLPATSLTFLSSSATRLRAR
jgi:hypothetical protein